ncbi:mannose-6-phosphate isomerase, class I [Beutenbergia cavernae DSM 12333]|uniref:mannose-6-phosphate isomerase n=1 Tax=Beutenbergia cavernae (strain ATCC BAA-8 / DSM 12333 / CCUG 43141 / JCM 11478 / NBRC 16432 / NCIMB 13614 / HKI 0122) TaxID=471853 RepID=C5BZE9_BEUC1|nr:mannose-6-phosphate isomerase, class I [Beutenbergia cavernae]ACQ79121.1 mannose-6-phosphate isomerase, class I [Beutenbergia cavernae DSM 12333]
MYRLAPHLRDYAWGSRTAIPELLGTAATSAPVAEAWFGAHPSAPSTLPDLGRSLDEHIAADPAAALGDDVVARFGPRLPYLLKLIAPAAPISLQVHPTLAQAAAGYAREDGGGLPLDAPTRSYRDRNHKPEIVFALTTFEALSGFRAPRRAAEILASLDTPLAGGLRDALRSAPSAAGMEQAFRLLLDPAAGATPDEVTRLAQACAARLAAGTSPSTRADAVVTLLQEAHPGDPGVVAALLLNPVTLQPGEALFTPAGSIHTYLSGLAVEVMANSDNVIRAGLTPKHVDVDGLLEIVDYVAAPPIRLAPERAHENTDVYYAPVDDFELTLTHATPQPTAVAGRGPRILLVVAGTAHLEAAGTAHDLRRGDAVFLPASDDGARLSGDATLAQAGVP